MEILKQWILVLLCTGFICSAVGRLNKSPGLKLVCSLAMLAALLWPIGRLKGMDFALPSLDEYKAAVNARSEEYMQEVSEQNVAIISERAAEYISEQAALMGIECEAEVTCGQNENGEFLPLGAVINSPQEENAELLQLISKDLGIKKEALDWKVNTNAQN